MVLKSNRGPGTIYEDRIDFEGIAKAQERRSDNTLRELRELLVRIEQVTIAWATEQLGRRKNKRAVAKYSMPLANNYREILRRSTTAAAVTGANDVAGELDGKRPRMRAPDLTRLRARADVLAQDHKTRLETDLKRGWSQALLNVIDEDQIVYITRLVFADFAGWKEPTP